jgi:hypothetical protein
MEVTQGSGQGQLGSPVDPVVGHSIDATLNEIHS